MEAGGRKLDKNDIFDPKVFTKIVGYGRVSSTGQEDNYSEASQREMYAKLRDEYNWGVEELIFEQGSGTSLRERPKLRTLLDRIENNNGDGICGIFVVEQDRLSRPENLIDYARICSALQDFNIKLVIQHNVLDLSDDTGSMMFDINSFFAKQGRRSLLRNMKRGKEQKANQGKNACGAAPDGYIVSPKTEKYEPDPNRSHITKLIFKLADEDYTVRDIKKELESRGIPSPRNGKQGWTTSHIHDVLTNRQYLGVYIEGITKHVKEHGCRPKKVRLAEPRIVVGTEDEPNHPPLVAKDVFYRVQEKLKSRKKRHKNGFELLTGIGVCYDCGELMKINYTGSDKKCYICKNKMKKGVGCRATWMETDTVNKAVWDKFRILMEAPVLIRELYKTESANKRLLEGQEDLKKSYESRIEQDKRKRDRLLDLYESEGIDKAEYLERRKQVDASINIAMENLKRVKQVLDVRSRSTQDPTERLVKAVLALRFSADKFTEEQKNRVFRKFVHRVPFHNDKPEFDIEFFQEPLKDLPANLCSVHFKNFVIGGVLGAKEFLAG